MQEKIWKYRDYSDSEVKIQILTQALNISKELAALLSARGIKDFQTAKSFFRPSINELPDPFLMLNMTKAVELLQDTIHRKGNVLIYGDYDVDGTSSVTILYKFLIDFSEHVSYYIPNRYTEGYGLSEQGIQFAIDNDIELILTLDCGIKAHEKIEKARKAGIQVIVCDHHLPDKTLPNALILNPKQKNCNYPFKDLAGVGVTYKLIQAYCKNEGLSAEHYLRFLDFVALGTGADLVPLVGENRQYVFHGLEKMNTNPSSGIQSIIQVAHCKSPILMKDIGFSIGPRINAAGRIGEASRIVDLFVSGDQKLETQLSKAISEENLYRRELDQSSTQEALSLLLSEEIHTNANVVYHPEWNKGIIGIVASRLLEHSYKPTVVLTLNNGIITGSARSVHGFNIHDAIASCSHLLQSYGGHAFAAGLTLLPENLAAFKSCFEAACSKVSDEQKKAILEIDLSIQLGQMHSKFFRILWQFEPFGMNNPDPIFSSSHLKLLSSVKVMGTKHLRFKVYEEGNPDRSFDVVAFNQIDHYERIKNCKTMTICYTPELNHWQGRTQVQLNLKDIRFNN